MFDVCCNGVANRSLSKNIFSLYSVIICVIKGFYLGALMMKWLFILKYLTLVMALLMILSQLPQAYTALLNINQNMGNGYGTWTPIDTTSYEVEVVGEDVGSLQNKPFAGWYTDTLVTTYRNYIAMAWARMNADNEGYDYIYLAILSPADYDGSRGPESYYKIIKYVGREKTLISLDSITTGIINNEINILITWTYEDENGNNNVAGAVYKINADDPREAELVWRGNIRATTSYEEYSRSCYVPEYNNGNGGFLIIWYTSYDNSVDGKWLYYDQVNGWTLTQKIDIASTNNLYYTKADQMLCIGGENKALVVYRKWDGIEGYPDLYATLVDTSNNVQEIKLYDYNGAEETIGVKGAYTNGYFLVPIVSGNYLRYDIVSELNGNVSHRDYVTSNGAHPYAIALNDRFILAWIDYYNDADGEPKVANIDLTNFYIHPQYGVSVTGGDNYYDRHPLIGFDSVNNKLIYVWSRSPTSNGDHDIYYATISLGTPTSSPSIDYYDALVGSPGDQRAHGISVIFDNEFVVAYTDTSDGEEDLLAQLVFPDKGYASTIKVYSLPRDADTYKQDIINLINNAENSIYIAVAFWDEGSDPCNTPGTIAKALVDKIKANAGIDIKVVMDNDTRNNVVKACLSNNGVDVVDDSTAVDENHIMHNKFIIVDGEKLLVSTANLLIDDIYHNNNTAVYIESPTLAQIFSEEFSLLANGVFGTTKKKDNSFVSLIEYNGRTLVIEGYFSPQEYSDRTKIPGIVYGYMSRASESVYFTSYIFTTSSYVEDVYNGIVEAHNNGLDVKGVFDELLNLDTPGRRIYDFIDNGVDIAIDIHPYKMHAKLFTIDNKVAVIGSWNPTKSATIIHDEYILVIRDPDETNGLAKQMADYILEMYNDPENFVREPYKYTPPHPIIYKVMFKPDGSGKPDLEWVEIYNPTMNTFDLSNWVIGDADNFIDGDDEGLYRFPQGTILPGHGSIVIAYNGSAFLKGYGFKPDYEIVNTLPDIPDLQPYDPSKYTGPWNLEDVGDEVVLAEDQNGFLQVIDAIWYGDSDYISGTNSGKPYDISGVGAGTLLKASGGYDALRLSDKYVLEKMPPGRAPIGEMAGLGGSAEYYIDYDIGSLAFTITTISIAVAIMVLKHRRRKYRGLSKLIALVIIVSVAVALSIAVSLWMSGIYGVYTKMEKLAITAGYSVWDDDENVWVIVLNIKNRGTSVATIDNVFINDKPVHTYRTLDRGSVGYRYGFYSPNKEDVCITTDRLHYVSTAIPNNQGYYAYIKYFNRIDGEGMILGVGGEATLVIIVPGPGFTNNPDFRHGLNIHVKIHTSSGTEYPVVLRLV